MATTTATATATDRRGLTVATQQDYDHAMGELFAAYVAANLDPTSPASALVLAQASLALDLHDEGDLNAATSTARIARAIAIRNAR